MDENEIATYLAVMANREAAAVAAAGIAQLDATVTRAGRALTDDERAQRADLADTEHRAAETATRLEASLELDGYRSHQLRVAVRVQLAERRRELLAAVVASGQPMTDRQLADHDVLCHRLELLTGEIDRGEHDARMAAMSGTVDWSPTDATPEFY